MLSSKEGNYIDHYLPWRTHPIIIGLDYPALFPQDATFFRLDWVRSCGIQLREELHNVMDTVLYFQLMAIERPLLTTAVFSAMRLHEGQKGGRLDKLGIEVREAVEPLRQKTPLLQKLLFSLIHQKFGLGAITRSFLRLAVQYGLLPSVRHWKIAVFSADRLSWKVVGVNQNITLL